MMAEIDEVVEPFEIDDEEARNMNKKQSHMPAD